VPRTADIWLSGPQLRADKNGYLIGNRTYEGFQDVPGLDDKERYLIAFWARAFSPETLSEAQTKLLEDPPVMRDSYHKILEAAIRNAEHDMPLVFDIGLYELLSDQEIKQLRDPSIVLGPGHSYPLNQTELSEMTGASKDNIAAWTERGYLPSYIIEDERLYFSAAVAYVFNLLKGTFPEDHQLV